MFFVGFRDRPNFIRQAIQKEKAEPPLLRDVLLSVGKIGSASNNRICKAKVTAAAMPVLRKSPYAGMLFNGQGRPMNLDGHSATLPASMGGNRTPIVDDLALYDGASPWVESYHAELMTGGRPIDWTSVPPRLRRLTIDEAIAIQTFPSNYQFVGPQSAIFRQIGNAVPCRLAEAVATCVRKQLQAPLDMVNGRTDELYLDFA
jgi:DNA (cytosine-5)-methyltransferase 1